MVEAQTPGQSRDEVEKAMWGWYLEWSTIARMAIKERHILRALGFRRKPGGDEVDLEAEETDPDPNLLPPNTTKPVLALPERASNPGDMRPSTSAEAAGA